MNIPVKKNYYRMVVTVDEHEYIASYSFDMSKDGRWGGFPAAHIYSGITSSMRHENDYASAVTITNVLQWHIENNRIEISDHAKDRLENRSGISVSNCMFPPTTLIAVFFCFEDKEFRFHQLVENDGKYYFFVFVIRKGGHRYPHDKFPSLSLETNLETSEVRLVTVVPATKRHFDSMKDVVRQEPSGTECIVWYEDTFNLLEYYRGGSAKAVLDASGLAAQE